MGDEGVEEKQSLYCTGGPQGEAKTTYEEEQADITAKENEQSHLACFRFKFSCDVDFLSIYVETSTISHPVQQGLRARPAPDP